MSTTQDSSSRTTSTTDSSSPAATAAADPAAPAACSAGASGAADRTGDSGAAGGRFPRRASAAAACSSASAADAPRSPLPPSGLKRSRLDMEAGAAKAGEAAGGEGSRRRAARGNTEHGSEAPIGVAGNSGGASGGAGGGADGAGASQRQQHQQQQQPPEKGEDEAPWLNSPRHEGGGGGGVRRAIDPPPRGPLVGKGKSKVIGMPQQTKARVVHLIYDHNTLVRDMEVGSFACPSLLPPFGAGVQFLAGSGGCRHTQVLLVQKSRQLAPAIAWILSATCVHRCNLLHFNTNNLFCGIVFARRSLLPSRLFVGYNNRLFSTTEGFGFSSPLAWIVSWAVWPATSRGAFCSWFRSRFLFPIYVHMYVIPIYIRMYVFQCFQRKDMPTICVYILLKSITKVPRYRVGLCHIDTLDLTIGANYQVHVVLI